MDPLTYIATGVVRDFGPWIVLLVGFAAGVTVFAQLSLVMNVRRMRRALEQLSDPPANPVSVFSELANSRRSTSTTREAADAR